MENKIIAVLLILIIGIYTFIDPSKTIEPFNDIETTDINKSLESIISDSETLNILEKENKINLVVYKKDAKNFLDQLKDKYKKYYELKTNTNFDNYGRRCQSWSLYNDYNDFEGNNCQNIDDKYQCIVNDGKLSSCDNTKLYNKNIKKEINTNGEIRKTKYLYKKSFSDIEKSLVHYNSLLDKEIKKFKAKQDIIVNQDLLLTQQKNNNKMHKKKLEESNNQFNETNDKFNVNYNKSESEKEKIRDEKKNLLSLKYYTKCFLGLLTIMIFIKMLFIKIK
tara:strand:- start:57 stop:893 length:837 start_codon:yes stop_codon:yes gene_type:complete